MTRTLLASTMLAGWPSAFAQQQADTAAAPQLEEVVVTAEKRAANLQSVPVAVQALSETRLEQMNVTSFEDFAKLLPSVTYQTVNPGQTMVYMRGIASGSIDTDGNHSGSQPTVGIYVDEIPTTTILGQIDFHVYDVQRIEALSGPQGTLYGASSEAGTLKIVTNQPDPKGFAAGYDLEGNYTDHGSFGDVAEGFVNVPISDNAAIRVVAFEEHDSGYINNVFGTRTYPAVGAPPAVAAPGAASVTINNASQVGNAYNDVTSWGGRAALKIMLDDDWTVMPAVIGQVNYVHGINAEDLTVGTLEVSHYLPETDYDRWVLPSLTVTGKIFNLDMTYAGGYFVHDINQQEDYTDYSYFYDVCCGAGAYEYGPNGKAIDISQGIIGIDHFEKISQELRFASPQDQRFRYLFGLFYEDQIHDIEQRYYINGLSPYLWVTGWPDTWWLTKQQREDRDYAVFMHGSYDILSDLTLDAGLRFYKYDNTNGGFDGGGLNNGWDVGTGQQDCVSQTPIYGAPCKDFAKEAVGYGVIYKVTLSYHVDPDKMVYFTASDGYRPGGINRGTGEGPYLADYLQNYEWGWKTSWDNNRIRWNGDIFYDPWTNFQFSFLAQYGLPDIVNAGQAVSQGIETDLSVKVTSNLTLQGNIALIDAHLTQPYCGTVAANGAPVTNCSAAQAVAPSGTQLPISPYVKGNLTGRYDWEINDNSDAFVQAALIYTGGSWPEMRTNFDGVDPRELIGRVPSYAEVDLSGGYNWGNSHAELYIKNAFNTLGEVGRYTECAVQYCGFESYAVVIRPLEIGIKFGQKF